MHNGRGFGFRFMLLFTVSFSDRIFMHGLTVIAFDSPSVQDLLNGL
jgi:hypothetical protein